MAGKKQHKQYKKREPKKYYFLASGKVEYVEDGNIKFADTNGVFADPEQRLNIRSLSLVQQMLVKQFHDKRAVLGLKPPQEVTDLTILSISFLGKFTQTEFHKDAPQEPQQTTAPSQEEKPPVAPRGEEVPRELETASEPTPEKPPEVQPSV
jgi:hypothetical protein